MNVFTTIILNLLACIDWFVTSFVRPLIDKIFDNDFLAVFAVFGFGTTVLFAVIWLINYISDLTAESQYDSSLTIANNDKYYARKRINEAKAEKRYQERLKEAENRYQKRKKEREEEYKKRYSERFPNSDLNPEDIYQNYFAENPNKISFSYGGKTYYNNDFLKQFIQSSNLEFKYDPKKHTTIIQRSGNSVYIGYADKKTGEILYSSVISDT